MSLHLSMFHAYNNNLTLFSILCSFYLRMRTGNSKYYYLSHQPTVQLVVWFWPSKEPLLLPATKGSVASIINGPLIKRNLSNLLFLIPLSAFWNISALLRRRYYQLSLRNILLPERFIPLTLQFWMSIVKHQCTFSFQVPMKLAILIFSGIASLRCVCSKYCPATIAHFCTSIMY